VPGMDAASGIVTARQGLRFYVTGWYDDHLYAVGIEGSSTRYTLDGRAMARTRESRAYHQLHPAE
jgi:hypothetical protein